MEHRHRIRLLAAAGALAVGFALPVLGEVLLTEREALERAFPGQSTARRVLYLRPEQIEAIERQARSKVPSAVVTTFEARVKGEIVGRAVLDTHLVRTMPETVLTAILPDGSLRLALVLQFGEPPDYLPREGWLRTFAGRGLDDELWPGRGVRRVTGATLTAQALTEAVRRALAIDRLILRGAP